MKPQREGGGKYVYFSSSNDLIFFGPHQTSHTCNILLLHLCFPIELVTREKERCINIINIDYQ